MLSKLWFFYKQSKLLSFTPKLSLGNDCHYKMNNKNSVSFLISEDVLDYSSEIMISLKKEYRDIWYLVLAHEVGHLKDKHNILKAYSSSGSDFKIKRFNLELQAWVNAKSLLTCDWIKYYNPDEFERQVTKTLSGYLVYCYEPQDRADVWCRVEKELGIRATY